MIGLMLEKVEFSFDPVQIGQKYYFKDEDTIRQYIM